MHLLGTVRCRVESLRAPGTVVNLVQVGGDIPVTRLCKSKGISIRVGSYLLLPVNACGLSFEGFQCGNVLF